MGRRQSMGRASAEEPTSLIALGEIQTILNRNIGSLHGPALTAITFVLQTSEQFGKKSRIKLAQNGPLVPQKVI